LFFLSSIACFINLFFKKKNQFFTFLATGGVIFNTFLVLKVFSQLGRRAPRETHGEPYSGTL